MLPSLKDQRFLITGGTGSFGRTMVSRPLTAGAEEVRVLSRDGIHSPVPSGTDKDVRAKQTSGPAPCV